MSESNLVSSMFAVRNVIYEKDKSTYDKKTPNVRKKNVRLKLIQPTNLVVS